VVPSNSLTVSVSGNGSVTDATGLINCGSVNCTALFASGTTLTATPSANNSFSGWSGGCAGTAPCTVSVASGNVSVTAIFQVLTPTLSLKKSHTGDFAQGSQGTWNFLVTNNGLGATAGAVTINDPLPSGYVAVSYSGPGWTCTGTNLITCNISQVVAGNGGTFPALSLTVAVPANSPTSVTNTATVYGGGDPVHTTAANGASASDTVSVLTYTQITQFTITTVGPTYVRATKLYGVAVTITNTGTSSITGPIELCFNGLPNGLTISTSAGTSPFNTPYLTIPSSLAPGASTSVTALFSNPSNVLIPINVTVYSGAF